MHQGQKEATAYRNTEGDAASPIQSGLGASTGSSSHSAGLRKQLWDRQRRLQRELQEVQDAINILDNDETVNKVLKVFEVAGK